MEAFYLCPYEALPARRTLAEAAHLPNLAGFLTIRCAEPCGSTWQMNAAPELEQLLGEIYLSIVADLCEFEPPVEVLQPWGSNFFDIVEEVARFRPRLKGAGGTTLDKTVFHMGQFSRPTHIHTILTCLVERMDGCIRNGSLLWGDSLLADDLHAARESGWGHAFAEAVARQWGRRLTHILRGGHEARSLPEVAKRLYFGRYGIHSYNSEELEVLRDAALERGLSNLVASLDGPPRIDLRHVKTILL